mmetsp:Transcript_12529/g.37964  ORF Transcript_12529/g.37964 Transcript_12529/m.37964 type:complete len:437 (+) Transcript_12529:36-1346(+)
MASKPTTARAVSELEAEAQRWASEEASAAELHGVLGARELAESEASPRVVATSEESARPDQGNRIPAHEYLDQERVLREKARLAAGLLGRSRHVAVYAGAGLSRAAGIADYASKASESVSSDSSPVHPLDARPTYSHCVLTALHRRKRSTAQFSFVQQNHDGLPQKANFPQECMNEIHGSWYDVSNPVIMMSGSLREDLFADLLRIEQEADLCLCLGTSLSGMNADRIAQTVSRKAAKSPPQALGTIIVNLQRTTHDAHCALRVWARLDDFFAMLAEEMQLEVDTQPTKSHLDPTVGGDPVEKDGDPKSSPSDPGTASSDTASSDDSVEEDVFYIPYDEHGLLDRSKRMRLDLREDALVRVVHEGAINFGSEGEVRGKDRNGHYMVMLREPVRRKGKVVNRFPITRRLGSWWVNTLRRGAVPRTPLLNLDPVVVDV